MKHILFAAMLAALVPASGSAATTNLLNNGDFTGGVYIPTGDIFGTRNQAPNGWIVTAGWSADFWSGSFCGNPCYTGIGNNVGEPLAGISQIFTDSPGTTYQVSFALSFRTTIATGAFFDASAGGGGFHIDGPTEIFTPMSVNAVEQFYFMGSGSDTLAFVAANSDVGSTITNVSVMAVPEPATWAMMLLGFAGLYGATRRRRA